MPETPEQANLTKAVTYTKTILWISWTDNDALLSALVKGAVSMIQNVTWYDLLNIDEVTDVFNWAWQRSIFLESLPVSTITKVEYNANKRGTPDWQELDSTTYVVQSSGQLTFSFELYRGFQNIKVTYETGFTDFDAIPRKYEQLKTAMSMIAWNLFNTRKQGWLTSESVSWTSLVFDKKAITSDIAQILDQFTQFSV